MQPAAADQLNRVTKVYTIVGRVTASKQLPPILFGGYLAAREHDPVLFGGVTGAFGANSIVGEISDDAAEFSIFHFITDVTGGKFEEEGVYLTLDRYGDKYAGQYFHDREHSQLIGSVEMVIREDSTIDWTGTIVSEPLLTS